MIDRGEPPAIDRPQAPPFAAGESGRSSLPNELPPGPATDGTSGGPSPAAFTIPSSPQHVFSREDGATCRLRWSANAEESIAGYRVYRLDGRWNKDPVSRLTSEPISETEFADETSGRQTRRYYVVAVDTLGQEGFPSSPVWIQREWRAYYEPFVGAWHQ